MLEKLKKIIVNYVEVDPATITGDTRFVEDLGFTSFDFMSMMGEIEDTFGVEVDENRAGSIVTVQEACDYLESLQ